MLEFATTVTLTGPALPDFYVQYELENKLKGVLPSTARAKETWPALRTSLRQPMTEISGHIRVRNVVFEPLMPIMGYGTPKSAGKVRTRENDEEGGVLYSDAEGNVLRCWTYDYNTDLDAPLARGFTSRYTPQRIAERVLLTTGERIGLLTNGVELRLIISEAARVASSVIVDLNALKQFDPKTPPDAFRLLVALASPEGMQRLEDILDDARLKQSKVTGELRKQAREAVEGFVQGILDHPTNYERLEAEIQHIMGEKDCDETDAKALLAKRLWRESLIVVYRILFILSGEAGTRERPSFSFSSGSIWRNTYSPSAALGRIAQKALESGVDTGRFLEDGLHALFRFFENGISSTELNISPLGGVLFGVDAAPLVDALAWGEHGCAVLLDKLLRAPRGKGRARTLVRLSYRDLDVEELGRVYEALLELDPGITSENMVRLRRQKLEVVVPAAQGEKYRAAVAIEDEDEADDEPEDDEDDGKKGKIKWIEAIGGPNEAHPVGRFFLRVGLGRKSSGSYYTPESFVKFLVQEALAPQCDALSPKDDPQPRAILTLNVLDPAMGSGHFLVGACRFLGERLYEACRIAAEHDLWERIPEEVAAYLPGRVLEGASEAGLSADRARAICKRLVVVNCLYGVDKNPLAVELAKVALWLESFAEGLPLTFLDHRLVLGDSLLGPLKIAEGGHDSPLQAPYAETPQELIRVQEVREQLQERLRTALTLVGELDSTIGLNPEDIARKAELKQQLDAELRPFVTLCTAWCGGIMLGAEQADQAGYIDALRMFALGKWDEDTLSHGFNRMLAKGSDASVLTYPLAFPEVFFPNGDPTQMRGFDAVVGNPPWDRIEIDKQTYYGQFDFAVIDSERNERDELIEQLEQIPQLKQGWMQYEASVQQESNLVEAMYAYQVVEVDGKRTIGRPDTFRLFTERFPHLTALSGQTGLIIPSSFHSNEGATGVRLLYLNDMRMRFCYSFENKHKLFEIHASFKFALIGAARDPNGTDTFQAGFYLHDPEWLFEDGNRESLLTYSKSYVEATGGKNCTFLEVRSQDELELTKAVFENATLTWAEYYRRYGIQTAFGVELHRNPNFDIPVDRPGKASAMWDWAASLNWTRLPIHAGKTIHQFTDEWVERDALITVAAPKDAAFSTRHWVRSVSFYRFVFRMKAASTNERTFIATVITPGFVCEQTLAVETEPSQRPNSYALIVTGFANSFTFDWLVRTRVTTSISNYLMEPIPTPELTVLHEQFIAHLTLQLTANHHGYATLWREQFGEGSNFPSVHGEEQRRGLRAAIDAIVAQAYGLERANYEYVLHSFDRASGTNPYTGICLEKWDELHAIGLEAFTRKHDPYHDIPLVETLPKPVIDLKLPQDESKNVPRDMFGDPLPTDIFGEVIYPNNKKKH